jgi:hypothetical protein
MSLLQDVIHEIILSEKYYVNMGPVLNDFGAEGI